MRRGLAFCLLTLVCAVAVGGCGDDGTADPVSVVEGWSKALNAGDNEAAADLFADNAVVVQGGEQPATLAGPEDARAFNASLPCGGKIVETALDGNEVTATFTLTRRPDHMCDDLGGTVVAVFTVVDGKITLWHQLPSGAAASQTA
jgi:limonene-1,2-epoxide hydrolase